MEIFIQARGHAVEICGPETGHVVKPVAYCDTANRAFLLVKRWQSYDALLEALEAAKRGFQSISPYVEPDPRGVAEVCIEQIDAAIYQATKEK